MNRLIIIGASGHGKVVADIATLMGYEDIVFLDDDESLTECAGKPIIGKSSEAPAGDIFIAVGNTKIRKHLMEYYTGRKFPVLVHPNAVIARGTLIGSGSVVMGGVVINPGVIIGQGCIVNTCSSIDHDCNIGDYVHIAVGTHICGTVKIGNSTWIGAGSTISNNVNICGECIIGAGAVVIKDIVKSGTYVGIPAKPIRERLNIEKQ